MTDEEREVLEETRAEYDEIIEEITDEARQVEHELTKALDEVHTLNEVVSELYKRRGAVERKKEQLQEQLDHNIPTHLL